MASTTSTSQRKRSREDDEADHAHNKRVCEHESVPHYGSTESLHSESSSIDRSKNSRRDFIPLPDQGSIGSLDLTNGDDESLATDATKMIQSRVSLATTNDNIVYEQHKAEIEKEWAANMAGRRQAPKWEKIACWKSKHPLQARSKPSPPPSAQPSPASGMHQSSLPVVPTATRQVFSPAVQKVEPVYDVEEPGDPSTWALFPGAIDRYRCGHRNFACIEGTCCKKHVCCVKGLSASGKVTSFKRAEKQAAKTSAKKRKENEEPANTSEEISKPDWQEVKKAAFALESTRYKASGAQQQAPQPAAGFAPPAPVLQHGSYIPPYMDAEPSCQPPGPMMPTVPSLWNMLYRLRHEAEWRERQRPEDQQDWNGFSKWWDVLFRNAQAQTLTQEEKAIFERPEPSTEIRTAPGLPVAPIDASQQNLQ